jgi:hypothetical protein
MTARITAQRIRRERCFGRHLLAALSAALLLALIVALVLPAAVAGATTGTSVSISTPSSSSYWSAVSVGVTVTADSGPNPTSGNVTITDSSSFSDFHCTLSLSGTDETSCYGTYSSVGTDTITADYEGSGSYSASSNSVQVGVSQASVTLSVNATEATVGETTTVTVTPSPGLGPNSSGTLVISDSDDALDCTTSLAGDEAQCTSADFTEAGDDSISASWVGNSDYRSASGSSTLDVGQASTVVASITAPSSEVGASATITVQVQPYPDGGEVSLTDADDEVTGCTALPVSPSTGQAVCITGTLSAAEASDELSAQYLGDANYAASGVTTGSLEIERGTTHLSLSADPEPSVGSTATYLATVSPSTAGGQGGTVAFSDSASQISDCTNESVNTATDEASCTSLVYSSTSSDTVSASYGGSTNWAGSSAQLSFSVAPGTPVVGVSFSPGEPTVGQAVTVIATISPSDGGGTVDFTGSYLSGCSAVSLSGNSARCTSTTLTSTGRWSVQAAYSGDSNYNSVTTSTSVTITAAATSVVLTSNPANPQAFASTTLTAAVSPVPDGGTVTFSGPGGTLGGCSDVVVSTTTGEASCPVAELPGAGSVEYSASYSGDTDYQANSGELDLLIGKIATSLSVSPSPNPVQAGLTSTLTISVSPAPDGGTVSVADTDGDLSCSNVVVSTSGPSAGRATCTTTGLTPAGSDSLSATYSGSSNYTGAAATGSITVEHIPSSTVITSADSYGVIGGELHVTVRVSPAPSSGTVSYSDSLGELSDCASVSVDPASGIASCVSPALTTTGEDVITVKFLQTSIEGASSVSTTIPIEEAPSFSSSLDATVTVGTPAAVQLGVSGYPAPSVSATSALPSGLSLSAAGEITGTAAAESGGSYTIGLDATNSLSSATGSLDLVVDQAPAISSATALSAAYGVDSTFQVDSGPGTYPVASFDLAGAVPDGMSFVDNGDGTATIAGTPDDDVSGLQSFAIVESNSVASLRVPFTIDVTGTPAPPASPPAPSSPPAPPSTESPPAQGSATTTLSPVAEALAIRKADAVPSAGRRPAVTERGSLPSTYDPIAPTNTERRHGKVVKVPVVVLGQDLAFPTLGNVGPYGDCAVVADSNIVRVDHLEGRLAHLPRMTTNEALSEWSALNGGTGDGLTDSQLLHAWAGPAGLLGTRIRGWSDVDPQDLTAMKRAILASGALYGTVVLPENVTLSTTLDPPISPTSAVSGHSLAVFGWTPTGFLVVTWGEMAVVPYAWWSQYAATAYAVSVIKKPPAVNPKRANEEPGARREVQMNRR